MNRPIDSAKTVALTTLAITLGSLFGFVLILAAFTPGGSP